MKDIEEGTITPSLNIPAHVRGELAVSGRLTPDPARAAELRALKVEAKGE